MRKLELNRSTEYMAELLFNSMNKVQYKIKCKCKFYVVVLFFRVWGKKVIRAIHANIEDPMVACLSTYIRTMIIYHYMYISMW